MDRKALMALAAAGQGEVERLSQELGKPIDVDGKALVMLGRIAIHQPDGEGYMRARVRDLVEDLIRRAPEAASYKYEYCYWRLLQILQSRLFLQFFRRLWIHLRGGYIYLQTVLSSLN